MATATAKAQAAAQGWRNRIVGHGEEDPEQLLASPQNWRVHPKPQQDALNGVLDEVGFVQDVIVNKTTGHVVDGHLRVSLAISKKQPTVPVVYVELTEDEERKVLATFDPIGAMAVADRDALDALLQDVRTDDAALRATLQEIAQENGLEMAGVGDGGESSMGPDAPEAFREYGEDIATDYCCPKCGYQWSGRAK